MHETTLAVAAAPRRLHGRVQAPIGRGEGNRSAPVALPAVVVMLLLRRGGRHSMHLFVHVCAMPRDRGGTA